MNFLLKIVEGPNRGAEIALVSGVAVTLGKGDDCDIVLADPTLPSTPVSIEASDAGVTVDGEPLEPFAVKTSGATSFAVGPSDAPWGELKWPEKADSRKPEVEGRVESGETADEKRGDSPASGEAGPPAEEKPAEPAAGPRRRGGCCGCLVALILLIIVLACAAWFYRAAIRDFCDSKGYDIRAIGNVVELVGSSDKSEKPTLAERITLATIAARYGLSVEEGAGTAKVSGNLKTRAERLRATAEIYEVKPGVELDLSDDESFRTAADDALFTLTEGALKVLVATNRVLSIGGVSSSPAALGRTLKALNVDLPKLRNVDVAGVGFGIVPKHEASGAGQEDYPAVESQALRPKAKKATTPSLPVCGILTKPYPCLVMRDGMRVLEGASLGENVILKIEADAVIVTNSMGRFTWKP